MPSCISPRTLRTCFCILSLRTVLLELEENGKIGGHESGRRLGECLELWFKGRLMEVWRKSVNFLECVCACLRVWVCMCVCVCIPVIFREIESQRSGKACLEFQLESKEQTKRDERKS